MRTEEELKELINAKITQLEKDKALFTPEDLADCDSCKVEYRIIEERIVILRWVLSELSKS